MRVTKKIKNEQQKLLEQEYGQTTSALDYTTPFELLIAVILSAQCTDERVNKVTARLFPRYNTPSKMVQLSLPEMEEQIHDCGLFHTKAKNILATCRLLLERFNEQVPAKFEDLIQLPGVGRKTANVVQSQAFGIPSLAVDTHVYRVSNRLGLALGKTPLEVEQGLKQAIPKAKWSQAHHWLIWHGRKICKARKPACPVCPLQDLCKHRQEELTRTGRGY